VVPTALSLGDGSLAQFRELADARPAPSVTFGDLEDRLPAEVAAVVALGVLEVLEHVAARDARGATAETFHDERFHGWSIGLERGLALPLTGDFLRGIGGGEELVSE